MFDFGILGNNARNLQLIKKFNPKKSIRLADNKYKTKKFLGDRGIPVPDTYALIKSRQELQQADFFDMPLHDYIVKPNKGSRGRGIYRVHIPEEEALKNKSLFNRGASRHLKVGSQMLSEQEWKTRMVDILEGQHSLGMSYDAVLVEELIIPGGGFEPFCEFGLADIRLIVHKLVPVAAMLRVPTAQSGGTANLDRGGLGIGINIATGVIESMSVHNKIYKNKFPPEYAHFRGKKIAYREDILLYSSKIQYLTNMGYLALDRVITEDGPKLLEINARAGMKFQLACILPLKSRLRKIQNLDIPTPEKGVEVCKSLFNPQKGSLIGNKDILYVSQTGELVLEHASDKKNTLTYIDAVIDIDMQSSRNRLSEDLYDMVQGETIHDSSIRFDHNKQVIKNLKRYPLKSDERAKIVLGRDAVTKYYIKPIKKVFTKVNVIKHEMIVPDEYDELHILDEKIHKLGRGLNLSRVLQPTNFLEQLDLFIEYNGSYNPRFTYNRPSQKRMDGLKEQMDLIRKQYFPSQGFFQSKFAKLFEEKLDELENKHGLIQAYKDQDFERIGIYNKRLYGPIRPDLVKEAKERIFEQNSDEKILGPYLTSGEVRARIRQMLRHYGIKGVNIVYDAAMTAKMSVKRGETVTIKIAQGKKYRDLELQSTLEHEIGVHVVRWLAGKESGRHIMSTGTSGFIVDEEGLASWKSREVLPPDYVKLGMRKKYYLLDIAKDKNFTTLGSIIRGLGTTELRKIFMDVLRIKKGIENTSCAIPGGAYMKDKVYAEGYTKILHRIENGGDPTTFMIGKVKIEDMQYFKV